MINSLNASGTSAWNNGLGFLPIGNSTTPFTGNFNGDGYTISNLTINLPSFNDVGLFGSLGSGGVVDSLILTHANITGANNVGVLVGLNNGTVTNSSAGVATIGDNTATLTTSGGSVTGTASVGGLIGKNTSSFTVNNDYADVTVQGTSEVGGLIGYNTGAVTASEGLGTVNGATDVGGLLGSNSSTGISGNFALGQVTGTGDNIGGLVGNNTGSIIQSNGAGTTTISGLDDVGGLVGNNTGLVEASFASAPVSGRQYVGGVVGYNAGSVLQDYTVNTATVSGSQDVGGLAGYSSSTGNVSQSYAIGNISYASNSETGDGNYFGGLIGENDGAVTSAYATGNVQLTVSGVLPSNVGGLIGYNNGASALLGAQLYATGSVTGYQYVGGLIGKNTGSIGSGSYTLTGTVRGNTDVGGLVGFNNSSSTLSAVYSKENVYGLNGVGGLIGVDSAGDVTGSHATGSVLDASSGASVDQYFGGLIGNSAVHITGSNASGTVTGDAGSSEIGGLVGYNTGTIDTGSSASGNVTGSIEVGGLVGNNFGGTIGDAYTYTSAAVNTLELLTSYLHATGNVTGLDGSGSATAANLGGLVGKNSGTVQQAYAGNTVKGTAKASAIGGLIGNNAAGTVSYTYSRGFVYGNGTSSLSGSATDTKVGGLVGDNSGSVTWSNSNSTVVGDSIVGGFVGLEEIGGLISQSYSYTSGGTDVTGGSYVGGFAGKNLATGSSYGIQQDYSTDNVSATGNHAGGLVGDNQGYVSENYSIGTVSGADDVGGSVGYNEAAGTLDQTYATGAVTSTGSNVGGLIGNNAGTAQYSYWDGVSTGLGATGIGANTGTASTSVTELDETSGSGVYSYDKASYVGFGSDSGTSSLQQVTAGDSNAYAYNNGSNKPVWYIMDGVTRPFLWWEAPINGNEINGSYQISTSHQLQLMAVDLSQNYSLAKSIDLTEVNGAVDKSSLWSSAGFSPVGYNSSQPFTGSFSGSGYTLSNLYINNPTFAQVGLFGDSNGAIGGVNLSNVDITGTGDVGALIGWNFSNTAVSGVTVTGKVTGSGSNVGGIIGENGDGTASSVLQNSYADLTVKGNSQVGGLVGLNSENATVQDVYSLGTVTGTGVNATALGGLVGENDGAITTTYSIANVTGVNQIGGLVGYNSSTGTIATSYSSNTNGSATYGNVIGTTSVGGLVGENAGGVNLTYSTDNVTGTTNVGGLAGLNDGSGSLDHSYASGAVTGSGATVGGLIGVDNAMTTYYADLYWDHVLAGQTNAVGSNALAAITDLNGTNFNATSIAGTGYNGFDGSAFAQSASNDLVYSTTNWRATQGSEFPVLTALSTQVSGTDYADAAHTTIASGDTVTFNSGSNALSNSATNPLLSNNQTTDGTGAYAFLYPADFVLVNDTNQGLIGETLRLNDAANNSDSIARTLYAGSGVPNLLADLIQADLWNDTVRVISTGLNNSLLAGAGSQFITVPDTNEFNGTDLLIAMPSPNTSSVSENFENGAGDTYTINGNITVNGNVNWDATATVGDGYTNAVTLAAKGTTSNPFPVFAIGSTGDTNVQLVSNNLNRSLVVETDGTFQNNSSYGGSAINTPSGSYAVYSQNPQGATSTTGTYKDGSNTTDDSDNGLTYYHIYNTDPSKLPTNLLIPGVNYLLFSYQPTLTMTAVVVKATPDGTGAVTPYNADSGATNPNTSVPTDSSTGNGLITYGDAISTPTPTSGSGYYLSYTYSGVVNGDVVTGTPGTTANLIISTQPSVTTAYAQYDPVTDKPVTGGATPYAVTFNGSSLPVSLIGYKLVYKSSNLEVQPVSSGTGTTPTITINVDGSQTFAYQNNGTPTYTTTSFSGSLANDPIFQNLTNTDFTLNTLYNSTKNTTFGGTGNTSTQYADAGTYSGTGPGNTGTVTLSPAEETLIEMNYGISASNITVNTGTYVVNKATVNFTPNSGSSEYGSGFSDPGVSSDIPVYDDTGSSSYTPSSLGYTSTAPVTATTDVGSYTSSVVAPATPPNTVLSDNYIVQTNTGTYDVTPAPLTLTANDQTKVYGNTFTFAGTEFTVDSSTPLKNGNTVDSTTLSSSGSPSSATVGGGTLSNGDYVINISGATGSNGFKTSNYNINYVNGALAVTPLTISSATISVQGQQTFDYTDTGIGSPAFTLDGVSGSGLPSSLTNDPNIKSSFFTTTLGAFADVNSGTPYTNTIGLSAAGATFFQTNYNLSQGASTLALTDDGYVVKPAAVTITAQNGSSVYGNGGNALTIPGVAGNYTIKDDTGTAQSLTSLGFGTSFLDPSTSSQITNTTSVGTYTGNVTYNNGTTTSTYTDSSTVSTTPNAVLSNYVVTAKSGTYTITPAPLTLTATSFSKQYGTTYTFAGTEFNPGSNQLQNGETLSDVSISSPGAPATANVNTYANTIATLATGNYTGGNGFNPSNYDISYNTGTLTVTRAPVTVYVNANYNQSGANISTNTTTATSTYGVSPSDPGLLYGALQNGESTSVLGLTDNFTSVINNNTNANTSAYTTLDVKKGSTLETSSFADGNYQVTPVSGSWLVSPTALTITANNQSKYYGNTFTFAGTEFTSSGLKNSQTIGSATLTSTGSVSTASVNGGPYPIVISGATGGTFNPSNYNITYDNGSMTVNPAQITVTAPSGTSTYGSGPSAQAPTLSATQGSLLSNTDTTFGITDNLTTEVTNTTNASTTAYPISVQGVSTGDYSSDGNYQFTVNNGSWTVNPANLTITADNESKVYGGTYTFGGTEFTTTALQNGESISSVTLSSPEASSTTASVGTYHDIAVTHGSAVAGTTTGSSGTTFQNSNYNITYVAGTLTVTGAPVTVYVNANYNQSGANISTNTTTATSTYGVSPSDPGLLYGALQNGESTSVLGLTDNFTTKVNSTVNASGTAYTINVKKGGTTETSSFTDGNYIVTPVSGSWLVSPTALTITANNQTKTYGNTVTFAGTEFTSSGLKNSQTIGSATITSTGAANTANVGGGTNGDGSYVVQISGATGGTFNANNYTITYVPGKLTINPKDLTVTATGLTKTYDNVPFTNNGVTYSGFVNSQNASALGGTLAYSGTAVGAVNQGTYTITPGGYTSTNYNLIYQNGTVVINPAQLTVTALPQTFQYDNNTFTGSGNSYTYSITGFATGDNQTNATTGSVTYSGNSQTAVNVKSGGYTITPGGLTANHGNYTFNYVNGTLTITPAPITVTAQGGTSQFGDTTGTIAADDNGLTYTGSLYGTDTLSSLGLGDNTSSVILPTSNATTYSKAIHVTGITGGTSSSNGVSNASLSGGDVNYVVTTVNGNWTVTPAPLDITAVAQSKTYGQSVTYNGALASNNYTVGAGQLKNTDQVASVTLTSAKALSTTTNAGTYTGEIAPSNPLAGSSTFVASNYAITYHDGTLTVNPAQITVTAPSGSSTYGNAPADSGLTLTGGSLVNGNSLSGLGLGENYSSTITNTTDASSTPYAIDVTGVTGGLTGNGNYQVTVNNGTWTVNQAPLDIYATAQSKTYGQSVTYDGTISSNFSVGSNQLQNSEKIGSVTLTSAKALDATTNTGTYTNEIALSNPLAGGGTGFLASNYSITYHNSTLTVNPAPVTVYVNANYSNTQTGTGHSTNVAGAASTYGTSPSDPGLLYGALQNSQSSSVLGLADNFTTVVNNNTDASGTAYGVNVTKGGTSQTSSFVDGNYLVTPVSGSWLVSPFSVTLTANSFSKQYGDTYTFTGTEFSQPTLKNGQTLSTVTITSSGAPASANVQSGGYATTITPLATGNYTASSGFKLSNYNITLDPGTLTVTTAPITVTAPNGSSTYGTSPTDPGLTYNSSQLKNGQSISVLGLGDDLTSNVNNETPVIGSPYTTNVTQGGSPLTSNTTFQDGNYSVTVLSSNWTVNQAPLTLTPNDQNKVYGDTFTFAGTEFTAGNNQLKNGETLTKVSLSSSGTPSSANVGGYDINIATLSTGNYTGGHGFDPSNYAITYNLGTLHVNQADLYITANSLTKVFGLNYIFTGKEFTVQGLRNTDSITSATITSPGAPSPALIGQYVISISNANYSGNYHIVEYIPGVLTVVPDNIPYRNDPNTFYMQGGFTGYNGDYPGGNLHRYYFFGTPGNIFRILPETLQGIESGSSRVDVHIGTNDYFGYSKFMVFVP